MDSQTEGRYPGRQIEEQACFAANMVFGTEVQIEIQCSGTTANGGLSVVAIFPGGFAVHKPNRSGGVYIPLLVEPEQFVEVVRALDAQWNNGFAVRIVAVWIAGSTPVVIVGIGEIIDKRCQCKAAHNGKLIVGMEYRCSRPYVAVVTEPYPKIEGIAIPFVVARCLCEA